MVLDDGDSSWSENRDRLSFPGSSSRRCVSSMAWSENFQPKTTRITFQGRGNVQSLYWGGNRTKLRCGASEGGTPSGTRASNSVEVNGPSKCIFLFFQSELESQRATGILQPESQLEEFQNPFRGVIPSAMISLYRHYSPRCRGILKELGIETYSIQLSDRNLRGLGGPRVLPIRRFHAQM